MYRQKEFLALARRTGIDPKLAQEFFNAKTDEAIERVMSSLPSTHKLRLGHRRFKARRDAYTLEVEAVPTVEKAIAQAGAEVDEYGQFILDDLGYPRTAVTKAWRARARNRIRRAAKQRNLGDIEGGLARGPVRLRFKTAEGRERFIKRHGFTEDQILSMDDPLPFEVREAMGEIKEPGYLVYRGGLDLAYDVETAKVFRAVADTPAWSRPQPAPGYVKVLESENVRPFDPIGPLRGRYVREDILDDINALVGLRSSARLTSDALVRWFKYNKVVANPATHFRNILSNAILTNLGGMPVRRGVLHYTNALRDLVAASEGAVPRAAKAVVKLNEPSQFYREAVEHGLLDSTMFRNELELMADSWLRAYGPDLSSKTAAYGANLYENIRLAAGQGARAAGQGARRQLDKLGRIYQGEEAMAKLALYRWARQDKGMGVQEAIEHAQKWVFDYGDLPPFIHALRSSPLGMPFVTFSFKALPRMVEASVNNPLRIGKYLALHRAVETMAGCSERPRYRARRPGRVHRHADGRDEGAAGHEEHGAYVPARHAAPRVSAGPAARV